VHFLPERVVFGCCDKSTSTNPDLHLLCFTVYDRVLRPVDRQMSRRFFEHGTRTRDHFQETAFALARPVDTRVKYHRLNPMRPSDVVDRHTMLHIAYQWTSCGKWVVAAVIDQRGETYASDVWLFDSSCGEKGLVDLVWGFAVKFGRRANVGWRLVIAKLGGLSDRELDGAWLSLLYAVSMNILGAAWISHLDEVFPSRQELPMVHVTLLSVENNIPWAIVDPHGNVDHEQSLPPPKEKEASPTVFIDESATTYVMSPSVRIPVSASPCTRDITPYLQYIPDPDSDTQSTSDALGILPLACTTLVRISPGSTYDGFSMIQMRLLYIVEAQDAEIEDEVDLAGNDIAQNYHELCLLSGMRTGKDVLPWHLRAVASMGSALGRLEVAGDCS
jgi:mediator of RNA polymerase II transcription subunit 13